MKRNKDGSYTFSPSDLTTFIESPFSAWMNRFDMEFPGKVKKDEEDASTELLQDKGMDHEKKTLAALEASSKSVVTIPSVGDFTARHAATVEAMKSGAPVIYQAALCKPPFAGYADFLLKVPGQSKLGDYYYEAWDSKLARSTKPYFVIQLLAYSEMLEVIQGIFPSTVTVVLGTGEQKTLKTNDFRYYFEFVKNRFLEFHSLFDATKMPTPKMGEEIRTWSTYASEILIAKDDLSQVAGIKSSQIKKLTLAGITTLTALGSTSLKKVAKLEDASFEKLKRQARLQVASKGLAVPEYEILNHPEGERIGLRLLPPSSPGDVYFDMEGYPLFEEKGLEYLFGAVYLDKTQEKFIDFWAHNRADEKRAFESWVDWVYARFKRDPKMHIYHYAAYEVTAMRKLSTQHATRESEVDDLLRNEVFVDLYKIVCQSMAVGEPSYSIKYIEHLYEQKRGGEVTNAGDSIVQYAKYLAQPDGADYKTSAILKEIRDYNEIDCVSTLKLCNWLREVQKISKLGFTELAPIDTDAPEREDLPSTLLAQNFLSELDGKVTLNQDEKIQKLLGELLEFHRREKKQYWWSFFDWTSSSHEELIERSECIGQVIRTKKVPIVDKKSLIAEYRFDVGQDVKFGPDSSCQVYVGPGQVFSGTIQDIDTHNGLLTLRLSSKKLDEISGFPSVASILPASPIDTKVITESILSLANNFKNTKTRTSLPSALLHFLERSNPCIEGILPGQPLFAGNHPTLPQVVELIKKMKDTTICIQGPPGAGKTYTGSHVILALLKEGKTVGVTSNSHKAIENLMGAVAKVARTDRFVVSGFKGGSEESFLAETGFKNFQSKDLTKLPAAKNGHLFIGGTAWTFSRNEACENSKPLLDYLFVDEAGQVSLANLVGMSRSTRNIVLMGDQRQLEQPIQGSHPGESGESCLNYLIQKHATIPHELGIFLGTTFRMRPEVCDFISHHFYESRLRSDPSTLKNQLFTHPKCIQITHPTGLKFVPVEHEDCSQSSEEEASIVNSLIGELLTCEIEENKIKRPVALKDILVVAPYNLQVELLKRKLPVGLEIGSVDRFQGREAAIVILSMCSSSLDSSPRGVEFLFNPNRINVAISRAKCLALVVGNPELAATNGNSIEKMRLINLFCGILSSQSKVASVSQSFEPKF